MISSCGINRSATNIARTTEVTIKSMYTDYKISIECLILPVITGKIPQVRVNTESIRKSEGLKMTDPEFHLPRAVDLLLGAGIFWQLICKDSLQ